MNTLRLSELAAFLRCGALPPNCKDELSAQRECADALDFFRDKQLASEAEWQAKGGV